MLPRCFTAHGPPMKDETTVFDGLFGSSAAQMFGIWVSGLEPRCRGPSCPAKLGQRCSSWLLGGGRRSHGFRAVDSATGIWIIDGVSCVVADSG